MTVLIILWLRILKLSLFCYQEKEEEERKRRRRQREEENRRVFSKERESLL
jgi:hypothetical protein